MVSPRTIVIDKVYAYLARVLCPPVPPDSTSDTLYYSENDYMTMTATLVFALQAFLVTLVTAVAIFVVVCRVSFRQRRRARNPSKRRVVAFFHPRCSGGGGGERVLWKAIQVLATLNEEGLPLQVVIYTVDPPTDSYQKGRYWFACMTEAARNGGKNGLLCGSVTYIVSSFYASTQICFGTCKHGSPFACHHRFPFLLYTCTTMLTTWVSPFGRLLSRELWKCYNQTAYITLYFCTCLDVFTAPSSFLSLLVEAWGTMVLAFKALQEWPPDVFMDTTGCAFTYPVARLLAGCHVGAYVHYPTISTVRQECGWM